MQLYQSIVNYGPCINLLMSATDRCYGYVLFLFVKILGGEVLCFFFLILCPSLPIVQRTCYLLKPCGLLLCQAHVSRHMSSSVLVALQPSSLCERETSAQFAAISPARRPTILYGIFLPLAFSNADIICRTEQPVPVPWR